MNSDIAGNPRLSFSRFWLLPGVFYLAGWVILSWPAALSFTTHFFGDEGDALQNVWNIWWIHQALVVKHWWSPYFTDMLYHPDGAPLIAQTMNPHNGLLALGVSQVLNQEATYNTMTVFAFVAGGMTCFALAWRVSRSWAGSLFAGAVFTFSHYHFAHALGHMQLVSLQWIPLFVLLFLRMMEAPTARRGLAAGLTLLLVALCDWYYVFYCVITGIALYVVWAARQRSPLMLLRKGYRGAFAAFLALVVLPLFAFARALMDLNRRDPLVGSHPPEEYSADLLGCFVPGGSWRFAEWTSAYWEKVSGGIVEASLYLGLTVLAVALWSRARLWLLLALLFWLLSLGPILHVWGAEVPWLPMPYRLLEVLVPPLSLSGCPARMGVMVTLFLGVACALGLVPFLRLLRFRVLQAAFFALVVFEYLPWEQSLARIEHPDYVTALSTLPEGAVHIEGLDGAKDLYLQTLHGRPILLGYISRWPTSLWDRRGKVKEMVDQGQYAQLLRTYRLRYLVVPNDRTGLEQQQCVAVFRGAAATIWVASDDELARNQPTWRVEPRDDRTLSLHLHSPRHVNRRFACVFSRARAEPGASQPLAIDDLVQISLDPNNKVFPGSVGVFDAEGRAIVGVNKELLRQLGLGEVWFTWCVWDLRQPLFEQVGPLGSLRID